MAPRLSELSRGVTTFAALLLLTGGGGQSLSAPLPRPNRQPQPLPRELVAAWTEAGATVGWMRGDQEWLFFREEVEGEPGEVPAFQFRKWTGGVVGKLPPPQRAFGLDFGGSQVTDAGLKGLQSLSLSATPVTDAGMKELTGLKGLQWLFLNGTKVADAGLKELAALKELKELDLIDTPVTDAGAAELRKALPTLIIQKKP
jgi:hypothetical protein